MVLFRSSGKIIMIICIISKFYGIWIFSENFLLEIDDIFYVFVVNINIGKNVVFRKFCYFFK